MRKNQLSTKAMILVLSLFLCNLCFAQTGSNRTISEDPSALAMTTDALFVRPVLFTVTVAGAALWVVTLPFSAAGGNIKQAGDTLVAKPAVNTFVRCLGCTQSGYKRDLPNGD